MGCPPHAISLSAELIFKEKMHRPTMSIGTPKQSSPMTAAARFFDMSSLLARFEFLMSFWWPVKKTHRNVSEFGVQGFQRGMLGFHFFVTQNSWHVEIPPHAPQNWKSRWKLNTACWIFSVIGHILFAISWNAAGFQQCYDRLMKLKTACWIFIDFGHMLAW